MMQSAAMFAILMLMGAQVEPPLPTIEYPQAQLTKATVEYRCFDGEPRMTIAVDFERERHILAWRHGLKDVVSSADLRRIEAKLSVLSNISYIDGTCSNAGSEEVRFLGYDAAGKQQAVSAIHGFGRLWITAY